MSKKLSIMLVDDSGIDLFLHEKFITHKALAHEITKFVNVDEALEYLVETDEASWPDVILLDIQMPMTDGFAFIKKYEKLPKKRSDKCHIIIVSSSLDFGDISRARANSQVLELLTKPLNVNELIEILKANEIM